MSSSPNSTRWRHPFVDPVDRAVLPDTTRLNAERPAESGAAMAARVADAWQEIRGVFGVKKRLDWNMQMTGIGVF